MMQHNGNRAGDGAHLVLVDSMGDAPSAPRESADLDREREAISWLSDRVEEALGDMDPASEWSHCLRIDMACMRTYAGRSRLRSVAGADA